MSSKKKIFINSIMLSYSNKFSLLIIGVVYTYFIANALGPDNYGILSYYLALITSVINVGGIYFLQGLLVVFMPKRKSKIFFMKNLRWQYYLAILFFVVIFIFSENIAKYLHKDGFLYLRYLAFLLLLMPLHDSFVFLFKGFKHFGKILKAELVVSFLNLFLAYIFFVFLSYGVYGVIYAKLISIIFGIFIFAYYFKSISFKNDLFDMREVKTYSSGFFNVILFKSIGGFSFTLFVGFFLSSGMLGLFYIAQKIVSFTISSLQVSITDVVVPFVVEDYEDKSFLNRYLSLSLKLSILISLISLLFIFLFGRYLLQLLWPEYLGAHYVIVLYFVAATLSCFNVLNSAYMSQNRTDLLAKIYFLMLLVNVASSILFMPIYGVYGAIFTLILSGLVYAIFSFYHLKDLGLKVDIVIRFEDIKYFYGLFRFFVGRLLDKGRMRKI